jgi:hypothetical protein
MKSLSPAVIVATQQTESYRKTLFYVNNFTRSRMQIFVRRETIVSTGKIKGFWDTAWGA